MRIDFSEPEDDRGGEDQEHKGKCSEKGRLYKSARYVVRETFSNLSNDMMASEEKSTPLLQVLIYLTTDIIKDSYQHLGGKMGDFPDLK